MQTNQENISKELGNQKIRKMQIGAHAYACVAVGQKSEWVWGDHIMFNQTSFQNLQP